MAKTTQEITSEIQTIVSGFANVPNRGASWMRIRRAVASALREDVGYDYFVKVRASREDRAAGRIQVRALFAGNVADVTLQLA